MSLRETVQLFQLDAVKDVPPVRVYQTDIRLTILLAFAAEGINLGTMARQVILFDKNLASLAGFLQERHSRIIA